MIISHFTKKDTGTGHTINFDVSDQAERLANVYITDIDKTDEHITYSMETRAYCSDETLSYDYYNERVSMLENIEGNYEEVADAIYYLSNAYIESVMEEETANPTIDDIDLDDAYYIRHRVLFNAKKDIAEVLERNDKLENPSYKSLKLQKN